MHSLWDACLIRGGFKSIMVHKATAWQWMGQTEDGGDALMSSNPRFLCAPLCFCLTAGRGSVCWDKCVCVWATQQSAMRSNIQYTLFLIYSLHLPPHLSASFSIPTSLHLTSSHSQFSSQKPKQRDWHPPDGFILGLWTLILLVFFQTYGIKHLKHIFWDLPRSLHCRWSEEVRLQITSCSCRGRRGGLAVTVFGMVALYCCKYIYI